MRPLRSIRSKFMTLTLAAILLSVTLVGAIAIGTARTGTEMNSHNLIGLICESKCDELNAFLNYTEEGTDTVALLAYETLDLETLYQSNVIGANGSGRSLRGRERTAEQQKELDEYLSDYISQIQTMFNIAAESNPSVLTYYLHINPEISTSQAGFWYSKQSTSSFEEHEMTDLLAYAPDDMAHVGWYYVPLDNGRPTWMEPYFNANLDETLISYVIPLYRFGTFIGVIGVDVRFDDFVNQISKTEILDSGYAFLTDGKGKILYHPHLDDGLFLAEVNSDLAAARANMSGTTPFSYKFDGVRKIAVWGTLDNGMTLVVCATLRDINGSWYQMTIYIIVAAVCVLALFALLTSLISRRIAQPLEQLAEASSRIIASDYDFELTYHGNDEVGMLTRSFQHMQHELRQYISDLNNKAYQDNLTHVKNKTALSVYTRKLDDAIRESRENGEIPPEFAVIMFDCNGLKDINDTWGHQRGDIYLRASCSLICATYAHSPVFRIGGDEFVTVLTQSDLQDRERLEALFGERADNINANTNSPWEKINIARGTAIFEPEHDTDFASVQNRADAVMYEDKRRSKGL